MVAIRSDELYDTMIRTDREVGTGVTPEGVATISPLRPDPVEDLPPSFATGRTAALDDGLAPIEPLLEYLWQRRGSDLLLAGGSPPRARIDGELYPIEGLAPLTGDQVARVVRGLLGPRASETYAEQGDVDFALTWRDLARLRCSAFTQRGEPALSMRLIPMDIPTIERVGLPAVFQHIPELRQGFVLVTGPTGSGKSTTLAALIDRINETRRCNILTIEDPIEFVHRHKRSAVLQREVGLDTPSFDRALRSALREDPDVLLLGEMRDAESMAIALNMAETGHLVFATLHTNDAPQSLDRILCAFPEGRKEMIRNQLSASIAAVVSQRLLPRVNGGRVAAFEILLSTASVRNTIHEGRTNQLLNIMRTSQKSGMCTMEMSLADLIRRGEITADDAYAISSRPDELQRELSVDGVVVRR